MLVSPPLSLLLIISLFCLGVSTFDLTTLKPLSSEDLLTLLKSPNLTNSARESLPDACYTYLNNIVGRLTTNNDKKLMVDVTDRVASRLGMLCEEVLDKVHHSEYDLHERNSLFLGFIHDVFPSFKVKRENSSQDLTSSQSSITKKGNPAFSRKDFYGSIMLNTPPLIAGEEKFTNSEMLEARKQIRSAFTWCFAQYCQLPFVILLAITSQEMSFCACSPPNNKNNDLGEWFTFPIQANLLNLVILMVNIGRWVKYVSEKGIIQETEPSRNTVIPILNSTKCAKFYPQEKLGRNDAKALVKFYTQTSGVSNLEHMEWYNNLTHGTQFILSPWGDSNIKPTNEDELKQCVTQLLTCLSELHKLGYAHLDIRWSNVIRFSESWYLIDCEYAREFGTKYDVPLQLKRPRTSRVNCTIDCYLVGMLMKSDKLVDKYAIDFELLDQKMIALRDYLLNTQVNTINTSDALKILFESTATSTSTSQPKRNKRTVVN